MRANRHTLGLAAVLLAMWYAGASQNNAAAYLLGFLTLSVAAASALHGWANLRGLQITAEPILPVFEHESLVVTAVARSLSRHFAVQLALSPEQPAVLFDEISPEKSARLELLARGRRRGRYASVEIIGTSSFPLGFLTARRLFNVAQLHHIYPEPRGALPLPFAGHPERDDRVGLRTEGEDFAGLREWHRGQSMRHVDWKAVARGQRLMVKQWSGAALDPLLLDWSLLPHADPEDRLRQLSRWLVLAERLEGVPYSLRLPGADIPSARGDSHFHRCQRTLAEWQPQ